MHAFSSQIVTWTYSWKSSMQQQPYQELKAVFTYIREIWADQEESSHQPCHLIICNMSNKINIHQSLLALPRSSKSNSKSESPLDSESNYECAFKYLCYLWKYLSTQKMLKQPIESCPMSDANNYRFWEMTLFRLHHVVFLTYPTNL